MRQEEDRHKNLENSASMASMPSVVFTVMSSVIFTMMSTVVSTMSWFFLLIKVWSKFLGNYSLDWHTGNDLHLVIVIRSYIWMLEFFSPDSVSILSKHMWPIITMLELFSPDTVSFFS